ncbi:YlqD protein [Carboxydocella sporoproducens DSM 16521]|uniref:YlqD protein n=2 Tax=Carboxydocella TaxID=178898 RepID=A0A1T4PXD5_9FIRM|nr:MULTISPECIES: YlqD family protein [Carboxydocella]AVX20485.1 YlqD protein [Carboxydocella thermautotrophica]AVX30906.1 YlqD protein [Carboxydocella thermautotrophica]SJZ96210.1 YlqD protein [Carboxydocella sporoproducens DSM 16521]
MQYLNEILIRRPVVLKVKVTEDFRQRMASEVRENLNRLDLELQQLDFLVKRNPQQQKRYELEKQKLLDQKQNLIQKLKEISNWTVGEEIYQGTVESLATLQIGQSFSSLYGVEVVLEDDQVIAIRQHEWRRDSNE